MCKKTRKRNGPSGKKAKIMLTKRKQTANEEWNRRPIERGKKQIVQWTRKKHNRPPNVKIGGGGGAATLEGYRNKTSKEAPVKAYVPGTSYDTYRCTRYTRKGEKKSYLRTNQQYVQSQDLIYTSQVQTQTQNKTKHNNKIQPDPKQENTKHHDYIRTRRKYFLGVV